MFPLSAYMSVALHHLVQWVDKGVVPPRARPHPHGPQHRDDGSLMALDEFGNPRGGIRTPYVDVPVTKYGVPNEGAVPRRRIRCRGSRFMGAQASTSCAG